MKKLPGIRIVTVALLGASVCLFAVTHQRAESQTSNAPGKGAVMHATGPFEVKMTPQKPDNPTEESANIARMTGDKQWHGELEGTSKVVMLATAPDARGSGVYVALERVTGTLKGRSGTFLLHHTGIMNRGVPELSISVVPDSGTGQLTGLDGKMTINIGPDKKHAYDFQYTLPDAQ